MKTIITIAMIALVMTCQAETLQQENTRLKAQVKRLTAENRQLKAQIVKQAPKKSAKEVAYTKKIEEYSKEIKRQTYLLQHKYSFNKKMRIKTARRIRSLKAKRKVFQDALKK